MFNAVNTKREFVDEPKSENNMKIDTYTAFILTAYDVGGKRCVQRVYTTFTAVAAYPSRVVRCCVRVLPFWQLRVSNTGIDYYCLPLRFSKLYSIVVIGQFKAASWFSIESRNRPIFGNISPTLDCPNGRFEKTSMSTDGPGRGHWYRGTYACTTDNMCGPCGLRRQQNGQRERGINEPQ